MASSSLKRSSSLGRLAPPTADEEDDYRYKMAIEKLRCDLVGFPYCCNKHYAAYKRPPYYADLDYPYYSRWYDRGMYYQDWPYYRRPWYYDEYYRDYMRGYEEGLKKHESRLTARSGSSADLTLKEPPSTSSAAAAAAAAAAEEAAAAAAAAARARSPLPPQLMPPPPPPMSGAPYYDRYYQPYWYNNYYYYRPPYYWRSRYTDSRAY